MADKKNWLGIKKNDSPKVSTPSKTIQWFRARKYDGTMPKITVTYKGIFNFEALYELVHDFLLENGFVDYDFPEAQGDVDMFEKRYLEKGAPLTGYWIDWKVKKIPEENPYFRYVIDLQFQGVAISKADVVEQGKKVTREKGEVNIFIYAKIETDYKKEWENHWFLKHLINYYNSKIFFEEFNDMHETTLYRSVYRLQSVVKRYLKMMGGELAPEKTAPMRG